MFFSKDFVYKCNDSMQARFARDEIINLLHENKHE